MLTDTERLGALEARIAKLEVTIAKLVEAMAPKPPAPPRNEVPAWAGPQGGEYGINYPGPPTVTTAAGNGGFGGYVRRANPDGTWRDPSGRLRDADGAEVTGDRAAKVEGPSPPRRTFVDDVVDRATPLHQGES